MVNLIPRSPFLIPCSPFPFLKVAFKDKKKMLADLEIYQLDLNFSKRIWE